MSNSKMPDTKMNEAQIKAALDADIITADQAAAMRADWQVPNTPSTHKIEASIGHEDNMRFLRSFSDVFIAIGLVLLALGLSGLTKIMGGGVLFLAAAAIMWAGAEYFGRKKRAHLPTLILALGFLIFVQTGFAALFGGSGSLAGLITVGAMTVFYWRIRLPFCIALIAASAWRASLSLARLWPMTSMMSTAQHGLPIMPFGCTSSQPLLSFTA